MSSWCVPLLTVPVYLQFSSIKLPTQKGKWSALLQQSSTNPETTRTSNQLEGLLIIRHDQHTATGSSEADMGVAMEMEYDITRSSSTMGMFRIVSTSQSDITFADSWCSSHVDNTSASSKEHLHCRNWIHPMLRHVQHQFH